PTNAAGSCEKSPLEEKNMATNVSSASLIQTIQTTVTGSWQKWPKKTRDAFLTILNEAADFVRLAEGYSTPDPWKQVVALNDKLAVLLSSFLFPSTEPTSNPPNETPEEKAMKGKALKILWLIKLQLINPSSLQPSSTIQVINTVPSMTLTVVDCPK